jgi:hypothetical protein
MLTREGEPVTDTPGSVPGLFYATLTEELATTPER